MALDLFISSGGVGGSESCMPRADFTGLIAAFRHRGEWLDEEKPLYREHIR